MMVLFLCNNKCIKKGENKDANGICFERGTSRI
nr:MAG TPA: hypothetical protein [Caudoviricetes sp.]